MSAAELRARRAGKKQRRAEISTVLKSHGARMRAILDALVGASPEALDEGALVTLAQAMREGKAEFDRLGVEIKDIERELGE